MNTYMRMKGKGIKPLPNSIYGISSKSIDNVPRVNLFAESKYNKQLQELNKLILTDAMNRRDSYPCGEMVYLVALDKTSDELTILCKVYGDYEHVPISKSSIYNKIINQYKTKRELILIHNHPNDLTFSFRDLKLLINTPQLSTIIAVGNNGTVYIMDISNNLNFSKLLSKLTKEIEKEKLLNKANRDISNEKDRFYEDLVMCRFLKNIHKYNIDYIVSHKRR